MAASADGGTPKHLFRDRCPDRAGANRVDGGTAMVSFAAPASAALGAAAKVSNGMAIASGAGGGGSLACIVDSTADGWTPSSASIVGASPGVLEESQSPGFRGSAKERRTSVCTSSIVNGVGFTIPENEALSFGSFSVASPQTSRRSSMLVRRSELGGDDTYSELSPSAPQNQGRRLSLVVLTNLQDIRKTDVEEKSESAVMRMRMPVVHPTFSSQAHLRDDDYWNSLFGKGQMRTVWDFVEAPHYQVFACIAIVTNAWLLNMDDELVTASTICARETILVLSILEHFIILWRLRGGVPLSHHGCSVYFRSEFFATTCCAVDTWLLPWLGLDPEDAFAYGRSWMGDVSQVLRFVWLTRFTRFIQLLPQLRELVHGVREALQSLVWVLIFMSLLLYAISILCTRLIGHIELDLDGLSDADAQQTRAVQADFGSMGRSIFSLFMIMSSQSLTPLLPLIDLNSFVRCSFVVFYVFAGWTLLAIMTGTVSLHMLMSKSNAPKVDESLAKVVETRELLESIFSDLDEDGSGTLSHDEFQSVLQAKKILRTIAENTNIKPDDLMDMWSWLDKDGVGEVKVEDFMRIFIFLNEPFTQKTVFKLQEKLCKDTKALKQRLLHVVAEKFKESAGPVEAPLRRIGAMVEQAQLLSYAVAQVCEILRPMHTVDLSGQEGSFDLGRMEETLSAQLQEITARIQRFVPAD